jgi:dTDP-4-amino-4,6-dideoxygalactose transaminase
VHYYPVPLQPWFRGRQGAVNVPNAVAHARTALSLPLFPTLGDEDQARVVAALRAWKRAGAAA